MSAVRGLKNRLCPRCRALTPHRTLYAKTESRGKAKWLQLFWACKACNSLNHVVLSSYRTSSPSPPLPSSLAEAVVGALRDHPLDFEELLGRLRREGGQRGPPPVQLRPDHGPGVPEEAGNRNRGGCEPNRWDPRNPEDRSGPLSPPGRMPRRQQLEVGLAVLKEASEAGPGRRLLCLLWLPQVRPLSRILPRLVLQALPSSFCPASAGIRLRT